MDDYALVLTAGSSSLKFVFFQRPDDNRRMLESLRGWTSRHPGRGRNYWSPPHGS